MATSLSPSFTFTPINSVFCGKAGSNADDSKLNLQIFSKPLQSSRGLSISTKHSSFSNSFSSSRRLSINAVSSEEKASEASSDKKTKLHFLVANAKFMLDEEEHFQELMRERLRHFGDIKREVDFWLLYEPEFLEKFPEFTQRLSRPAVALASTDELWIVYMKLRLDRVLKGDVEFSDLSEVLKSKSVELEFNTPENWVAPYPKYEGPWWVPFLPKA